MLNLKTAENLQQAYRSTDQRIRQL